jgi:hypothetical protein
LRIRNGFQAGARYQLRRATRESLEHIVDRHRWIRNESNANPLQIVLSLLAGQASAHV